jgi:hypothetical protein
MEVLRSTSFERKIPGSSPTQIKSEGKGLSKLCKVLLCMTEGCTLDAEILPSGLVTRNTV